MRLTHASRNSKKQTKIQPIIGINSDAPHEVVKILNITLADEAMLSMKTRAAHSNVPARFIQPSPFFLQIKQLVVISNAIMDRVLLLGDVLTRNEKELLKSRLDEQPMNILSINSLLANHETVMHHLRADADTCSKVYEDHVTSNLLMNILDSHEKMAGMLRTDFGDRGEY